MVCDACGAHVDVGARFCGSCGAVVAAKTNEWVPNESKQKQKAAMPKGRATKRGRDREDVRSTSRGTSTGLEPVGAAPRESRPDEPEALPLEPEAAKDDKPQPNDTIRPPPSAEGQSTADEELPLDDETGPRNEFQRLLDEVEVGFDAILVSEPTPSPSQTDTNKNTFDEAQAKRLFDDLVIANAQPIRDFMIEVRLGEPHGAWLDNCAPATRAILRSAQGMGFGELAGKMQRFMDALDAAKVPAGQDQSGAVRGEVREKLIDGYSELIAFFPEAFALEAESNQREALVVRAILTKVEGLHRLALDRIHDTGMASLGLFYVSRPKDIAELASLPIDLAERLIDQFRAYRQLVSDTTPARGRTAERNRLRELVNALVKNLDAYDACAPASKERRELRRLRTQLNADMQIVLARLGQVERVKDLDLLAYRTRVEALFSYLEEAERKALAELAVR